MSVPPPLPPKPRPTPPTSPRKMVADEKPPALPPKTSPRKMSVDQEKPPALPPKSSPRIPLVEQNERASLKTSAVPSSAEMRTSGPAGLRKSSLEGLRRSNQYEKFCSVFINGLKKAKVDVGLFNSEMSFASFPAPSSASSESLLLRILSDAGLESRASLSDPQNYRQAVRAASETFDAMAFVPLLFHELKGSAVWELAEWAVEEHVKEHGKTEQKHFFGAATTPDIYTLIVEYFLERTAGFFFERLIPSSFDSSLMLCEGMLDKLCDSFELPQVLVMLAKRLEQYPPAALNGLVFVCVLGGTMVRRAAKARDDAAKQLLLGAKDIFVQTTVDAAIARKSSGPRVQSTGFSNLQSSINKLDERLRLSAGKIETFLMKRDEKSSSSSPPPPSSSSSASRPLSSVIELDDSVLVEAGVDESWSHERILQEVVSELRSKVLTELLKRPTSRVCIDAMQFLEIEGLVFEKSNLPLLPAKPPSMTNRTCYKNYMKLRFLYSDGKEERKSTAEDDAEKLTDEIFFD